MLVIRKMLSTFEFKEIVEKIRGKECHLVPNFIDCSKFSLKEERKDEDFILLSV